MNVLTALHMCHLHCSTSFFIRRLHTVEFSYRDAIESYSMYYLYLLLSIFNLFKSVFNLFSIALEWALPPLISTSDATQTAPFQKVCWSPPLTAELLKCGAAIWVAKITITFGECRGAHIKPINQPGLVHEGLTPTHSQTGRVGATLWLAKALFDWHEYPWVCCKAILWKGSAPCFFAAAGPLKIHTQNCQIQVRFPCKRKSSDWVIGGHISQYMSLRGWVGQAYIVHFHVHLDLTLLVQLSTKHTRAETDKQTDRQTARQAGRQTGRQTERIKTMPETPAPTIHDLSIPPFLGQLLVQGLELLSGQRGASFVPFLFQPQGAVGGKPSWLVTASAPSPFNCKRAKVYTMWIQVAPKDCRGNSQSSPNTTGHQVLITWKNCFMAETISPRFPTPPCPIKLSRKTTNDHTQLTNDKYQPTAFNDTRSNPPTIGINHISPTINREKWRCSPHVGWSKSLFSLTYVDMLAPLYRLVNSGASPVQPWQPWHSATCVRRGSCASDKKLLQPHMFAALRRSMPRYAKHCQAVKMVMFR